MDCKSMGRKLRASRAQHGWSMKECADRAGISTRYLADIERGDKVPKLETLLQLLNTLDVSAYSVLQDSLSVGYETKSNDLMRRVNTLDSAHRKQAIDLFEAILSVLGKPV